MSQESNWVKAAICYPLLHNSNEDLSLILCSIAEFRAIREKYDFFTLCQTPDLACEVTLMVSKKYDFFTLCQTPDLACEVTLMVSKLDHLTKP